MKIETILASKGPRVYTISPAQPLKDALALLAGHNVGALVVLDEGERLAGILSERDVIRAAAGGGLDLARPVRDLMTANVVVGSPQDDVASVMRTMTERRFRHLPIVENARLVGLISIGDLVKAQLDRYQGENDTLETQILES